MITRKSKKTGFSNLTVSSQKQGASTILRATHGATPVMSKTRYGSCFWEASEPTTRRTYINHVAKPTKVETARKKSP